MSFPPGEKGAQKTMTEIAQAQGMTFVRSFSLPSVNTLVALMEVSGPTPLANFLPNLQSLSQVQYAQPNQLYRTTAYNDPLSDIQYGPRLIDADRAHQVATGQDVSVAIIDTSIDGDQPDLRGKVIEQIDFIGPDAPGLEGIHGTLMSGVISAGENNQVGGFGVAPHVKLLGLKACQPLPENPVEAACSSESIAKSLDLAIRRKVRLINMSLGGPPDRLIETLIKRAAEKDIIMVAAAGNEGPKAPPSYPAAYEPVLAVSAVDLDDERYDKANVGSYIDLSAPGVDILSTLPGERFNVFSGTSIATAHVTAAAALLLQAKPELSSAEVVQALEETAVDLGRRGRDSQFGAGRINACRALEKVTGTPICP
jgi:subtilisin family serine protease